MKNDRKILNLPHSQCSDSRSGIGPKGPAKSGWTSAIRGLVRATTALAAGIRRRRQAMSAGSARRRFDYWIRAFTVSPYRAR